MIGSRAASRIGLCLLGTCCGGTPAEPPVDLPQGPIFDPGAWTLTSAQDDPFADRPDPVQCAVGGYGVEAGVFEVDTSFCGYLTAVQPLPVDLPAGARLKSLIWHLALLNDTPAQGHVALRLGEHLVFEARPPIPGPEAAYPVDWALPEALPAGTLTYFHIHNHGSNSWRLGPIEVKAASD